MSATASESTGESAADPSGLQAAIREGHVDADHDLDTDERWDLITAVAEAMNDAVEAGADPEEVEKAVVGYVAGRQSANE